MIEIELVCALDINGEFDFDPNGWQDLSKWRPLSQSIFCFVLTLTLGFSGIKGTNNFSVVVCTKSLLEQCENEPKKEFRLLIEKFDWKVIKSELIARVHSCDAETWELSLERLRNNFFWEYEEGTIYG